jgi:hypothetical protein
VISAAFPARNCLDACKRRAATERFSVEKQRASLAARSDRTFMAGARRSVQSPSGLKTGAPVSLAGSDPPAAPSVTERGCQRPISSEHFPMKTLIPESDPPFSASCVSAAPSQSATTVSTRRNFLMNSIVALPILAALPVAAPAMAPSQSPGGLAFVQATSETADPAFEAIKRHRKAVRAVKAADAEQERLLALAEEAVGPRSINVLDMREPSMPPGFHPYVTVNCWIDIEKYVSPEADAELYAHYLARMEEQTNVHDKYLEEIAGGDIDEIRSGPAEAELEAEDELAETVPTSLPGLLAMLSYVNGAMIKDGPTTFDEDHMTTLFGSLAKAAKALARPPIAKPAKVEPSSDPVFGLIEAHRKAEAKHNRSVNLHGFEGDPITEKSFGDVRISFMAVVEAAATTPPGLVAKATYLQDLARREAWMFEQVDPVAVQLVEAFAASVENVSAMA